MQVIRPWLVLGKYQETLDLPLLQAQNIGAMLQFAEPVLQPAIPTLYIPLTDGTPITREVFRQGLDFILTHHEAGKKVFVSCGAGISRSVTFVVAALKETENTTLLEAYKSVLQVQARALPHPVLWQSLSTYYGENTPYWQLLKQYNRAAL